MVRLIPVERNGQVVYEEDRPLQCAEGHEQLVLTHGACPQCREPVRKWQCRAEGCRAPDQIDDEHVHHSRRGLAR